MKAGPIKLNWERVLFTLLILSAAFSIFHYDAVSSGFHEIYYIFSIEEPITVDLPTEEQAIRGINYEDVSEIVTLGWNLYVPNYDADVIIEGGYEVKTGSEMIFKIRGQDTGIVKMEKPCLIAVIVDSEKKVVSAWPPYLNELEYYEGSSTSTRYSVPRETIWQGHGEYSEVERERIIKETAEVRYKLTIPEDASVGYWELCVFVFDKTYVDRQGNVVSGVYSTTAVAYDKFLFTVRTVGGGNLGDLASHFAEFMVYVTLGIFTWGIYGKIPFNRVWRFIKKNAGVLFVIVFILLADILLHIIAGW